MRLKSILAAAIVICAIVLFGLWQIGRRHAAPQIAPATPPLEHSLRGVTVILDPGHGGEDPGAVSRYAVEAAYTYRAALEIGQYLQAQGAEVVYTVRSRALDPAFCARQPDLPMPADAILSVNGQPIRERHSPRQLWLRAATARHVWNARAGLYPERRIFFLSLHMDDSPDPDVRGSLVCVDRRRPPPAFALALALSLARDGLARSDTADGARGLSVRSLGVLNPRYNPVPQSALLEITTLSHLDDLLNAAAPAWRAQMAERIARAIVSVTLNARTPVPR